MYIAGIDYSCTSPAMTIWDIDRNEHIVTYFIEKNKKYISANEKYIGLKLIDTEDRQYIYAAYFTNVVQKYNPAKIYIEGYAYGAQLSRGREIAEATGCLKQAIYTATKKIITPIPPKTIKKAVANNGNATKEDMYNAIGIDFSQIFPTITLTKSNIAGNPISDIVDSIAVIYYIKGLQ